MRDDVLEILEEVLPGVDVENEKNLVESGILNSMKMISLVTQLNDEFDIEIGVDKLVPENFESVDAITKLVESLED